jgi:hypothetical protein
VTRRITGGLAAAAILIALVGAAPVSLARFHDGETVGVSFATATLAPPTALAGTGGSLASLTWTPSTSGWAAGYELLRSAASGSGYDAVGTVTPVAASATTDSPGAGTWFYVLRTTLGQWHSVRSNEASVVVAPAVATTGAADCTTTQPETVDAGDNDGYEGSPGNACALDGAVATDSGTGTSTTNSCTSNAKDRHRFWGYALGLPATVTSIDGITVEATAGMNNNGGTTWLCVQLSADAGATWTAPQTAVLSGTALAPYVLGGKADAWGRTWALGEFDPASFRVRVIDSSAQPNKQFRLDAIRVSVTYTP